MNPNPNPNPNLNLWKTFFGCKENNKARCCKVDVEGKQVRTLKMHRAGGGAKNVEWSQVRDQLVKEGLFHDHHITFVRGSSSSVRDRKSEGNKVRDALKKWHKEYAAQRSPPVHTPAEATHTLTVHPPRRAHALSALRSPRCQPPKACCAQDAPR